MGNVMRKLRRRTAGPAGSKGARSSQAGFSLIEVLFAGGILVIGFMGLMALMLTAIATNNRNKMDSSGTMLAATVLEQIHSTLIGSGNTSISDCNGVPWPISTDSDAPPGAGALLSGANVDYTEATPPSGYHMNFAVGGGGSGLCSGPMKATYDVRWNIQALPGPANTYLVTVSAKALGASVGSGGATAAGGQLFALPVTLRSFMSPCHNWGDC